jgi:hypothetical protein
MTEDKNKDPPIDSPQLDHLAAFGVTRLDWRTGFVAFGSQVIVWALLWGWAQRSGA